MSAKCPRCLTEVVFIGLSEHGHEYVCPDCKGYWLHGDLEHGPYCERCGECLCCYNEPCQESPDGQHLVDTSVSQYEQ